MPNIRGSQRGANLFAAAMASHRCVCCKAHLYLQIEYGQATGSALPRRYSYSICGKHCAAEYTRKFKHLNRDKTKKNPLQHIEKLPIARFQQAHSQVRMQWKRRASEPYRKAESGSQPTHNKRIARLSTTTPEVQIPTWVGTQQNANAHWRCFWQRYPPNTQQNSPCI